VWINVAFEIVEFVERMLDEAAQAGEFDSLAAAGRKLEIDPGPGWWIRRELARDETSRDSALARSERALASLPTLATEEAVRERIGEINRLIAHSSTPEAALDADAAVATWRRIRRAMLP